MLIIEENKPRGKESTKVRISQNKGKESENSSQKLKRSLWVRHMETVWKYFDKHGHLYQFSHKLSNDAIFVMCSRTFALF